MSSFRAETAQPVTSCLQSVCFSEGAGGVFKLDIQEDMLHFLKLWMKNYHQEPCCGPWKSWLKIHKSAFRTSAWENKALLYSKAISCQKCHRILDGNTQNLSPGQYSFSANRVAWAPKKKKTVSAVWPCHFLDKIKFPAEDTCTRWPFIAHPHYVCFNTHTNTHTHYSGWLDLCSCRVHVISELL